ncbi:MAG: hypothetical protein OEY29_07380 [Gammaproteobacteria bacterium]|nr:hypothetical protein [Gammaproteobacteria bacterium]
MNFKNIFACVLLTGSLPAFAADNNLEINSFLTVAASMMSEEGRYLDKVTEHLSLENDSVYGFNIRKKINDKVSGAAQLLASSNDSTFDIEAEWAYLSYKLSESSSFRVGKLNMTTFLISDYINVGYLYPWIRTPVEVYENNPLQNFLGAEWLHITRFGKSGKFTTQVSIGSAQVEKNDLVFRATEGLGLNFQLDVPNVSVRLGAMSPTIQLEDHSGAVPVDAVDLDDRGYMYTAGIRVNTKTFVLYSEAVMTDTEDQTQAIFPNQKGAYVTLGYKMGKFLPHITFASAEGDVYLGALPAGIPQPAAPKTQDSVTYGLRYNIENSIALKFEYQMIELTDSKGDGYGVIDANTATPGSVDSYGVATLAMDFIF